MNQLLEQPILGLDTKFPENLIVLQQDESQRFGCYCHDGIHGLACFSNEGSALEFADSNDLSNMLCRLVTFDEAREIAKNRPLPVVAIILLDRLDNPQVHFIR